MCPAVPDAIGSGRWRVVPYFDTARGECRGVGGFRREAAHQPTEVFAVLPTESGHGRRGGVGARPAPQAVSLGEAPRAA